MRGKYRVKCSIKQIWKLKKKKNSLTMSNLRKLFSSDYSCNAEIQCGAFDHFPMAPVSPPPPFNISPPPSPSPPHPSSTGSHLCSDGGQSSAYIHCGTHTCSWSAYHDTHDHTGLTVHSHTRSRLQSNIKQKASDKRRILTEIIISSFPSFLFLFKHKSTLPSTANV